MIKVEKIIEHFKIIPSNKANKILEQHLNHSKEKNVLYVVAGPNGSGKSTLIANIFSNSKFNVRYVNADVFARTIFGKIKNSEAKNKKAMYYTMDLINNLANTRESLIYETVFSHPSKLEIINNFKDLGYKIVSIFVTTKNPKINIARVDKRVIEGGHDVPKDKIISRWQRSNQLKYQLLEISDIYYEIDNSEMPIINRININYNKEKE